MIHCGDRIFSGERALTVWREHRGLSLDDLAKRCGLSGDYLRKCELGKRHLSVARVAAVAAALGIDPCELQPFPAPFGHCGFVLQLTEADEEDLLASAEVREDSGFR